MDEILYSKTCMISKKYLNVVCPGTILVEALCRLDFRNVQQRFKSDFTLSYKMNVTKRRLSILSNGLVEFFIFSFLDI